MTKLQQLIDELCPNGVEYKMIGGFAKAENARNRDLQCQNAYSITQRGLIPTTEYFGDTKITSDDTSNYKIVRKGWFVYSPSRIDVGSINYLRGADEVIVSPLNVVFSVNEKEIRQDYLLNYLSTRDGTWQILTKREGIEGTGRKLLPFERFATISVPVPPLAIQDEICEELRCLSEYVSLLTAELTARQKQYEYYRDLLLTFSDVDDSQNVHVEREREGERGRERRSRAVRWLTLNDVILSLNTGLNPRQFFRLNTDDAENYYITIREIHGGRIVPSEKTDRINDEALCLCNNRSNLEVGDVLFSGTGTIGETAVITEEPSNWNIKEGVYTIKPDQTRIVPQFLRYLLTSEQMKTAYMKKVAGGTVKSIPMAEMRKLLIPVPSIDEQKRIVLLLSRFDTLCNDLKEGLPAEIEARQRQYEYYRDRLLTFKEAV